MSKLERSLEAIAAKCEKLGNGRISRETGIPMRTIQNLRKRGFRTETIDALLAIDRIDARKVSSG